MTDLALKAVNIHVVGLVSEDDKVEEADTLFSSTEDSEADK